MTVATSIIHGATANADLAAQAVQNAMQKAELTVCNSVLLFLTSEFASNPLPAIKAAAKVAQCTQIIGCSATGIFTEEDWVLDGPAAAVMVFGGELRLQHAHTNTQHPNQPLLTITAPNAINSTWLNDDDTNDSCVARYGGVSGDATGQGPFSVWQNAKGEVKGFIEATIEGAIVSTQASHGLHMLTAPQTIKEVSGYDIYTLEKTAAKSAEKPITRTNNQAANAYAQVLKAWQLYSQDDSPLPLHRLMAVYANTAEEITKQQYQQTNIISVDAQSNSITLAQPLQKGQVICWGLREIETAKADLTLVCNAAADRLNARAIASNKDSPPDFGLLFSCVGRGPYFYGGVDQDLKIIQQQFPNMPLLGFYGNGEIAHIHGQNQLLPYSAVLSLFKEN